MNMQDLQECVTECERALTHLKHAMGKVHEEAKPRLQHASQDLQECINECKQMLH